MADNKNVKQFKCMNFGACAKADAGEIIEIDALETLGGIPDCPCCHQHTLEEVVKKPFPTKLVAGIAAAVLVLGGGGYGLYSAFSGGNSESQPVVDTTEVSKQDPDTGTTVVQKETLAQEIKINEGDISLKEGENSQLTSVVTPEKIDEEISWSSDNEAAAKVDATGKVTAVKAGTANIKIATSKSGLSASVKVTVTKKLGGGGEGGPTKQPFSYGKYVGSMKNGVPDGTGKLTFTRVHQLNSEFTAQPGEYIQGIFENGQPTFVTYYANDGGVHKIKLR